MSTPRRHPADRRASALVLGLLLAVSLSTRAAGQGVDPPARQVTLFGVIASPHDLAIDQKLAKIEPQLRKLLPGHGFRLLDVQSKRLTEGQALACDLEGGFRTETTLLKEADDNGKVQLRCTVLRDRHVVRETLVTTPPNQLFFCDKELEGGKRLLIGIGAR